MAASALEAHSRRDGLITLGLGRAALFTWVETASWHEDVYLAAVSVESHR
jgi:hypothetical protein